MDTNPSGVSEAQEPQHASEREAAVENLLAKWNPPKADTPPAEKPQEAEAKPETEAEVQKPAEKTEPAKDETDADAPDKDKAEAEAKDKADEIAIELDGEKFTPDRIRELKKGAMLQADYTRKTQAVAEQRKAIEAKAQEFEAASQQRLTELGFLSQALQQQLTHVEQNVNMDDLRQRDPVQFNALVAAMQQRRDLLGRAFTQYQQIQQARAAQQQEATSKRLAEEAELLKARIPEWVDEQAAEAQRAELSSYLVKDGFTKDDEPVLTSHKVIALARKAMLYDRQQAELAKAKEKAAKPVPKFTKSGAEGTAPDKRQKAMDTLRVRGDRDSAVEALLARQR